jgi:hypothetical protein
MGKNITMASGLTIGLDLGDKHTVGCVLSTSGEVLETFTVATTMSALGRTLAGSGGPGQLTARASHRSGRARLTHPAPQVVDFATRR